MEVWRRFWKLRCVADSHTFQTGAGLLQTGTVDTLKLFTFINKDSNRAGIAAKISGVFQSYPVRGQQTFL